MGPMGRPGPMGPAGIMGPTGPTGPAGVLTPGPGVDDLSPDATLADVIGTLNALLASLRTAGVITA